MSWQPQLLQGYAHDVVPPRLQICGDSLHATHVVEPECCKRLADYYGANSTRPSKNCFCSQPYFTKFSTQTKSASVTTYFQGCRSVS